MEENEPFFMSIEDANAHRMPVGLPPEEADLQGMPVGLSPEDDPEPLDEALADDDAEDAHPERFYLACHKALVRLKRYAASSPSF